MKKGIKTKIKREAKMCLKPYKELLADIVIQIEELEKQKKDILSKINYLENYI